MIGTIFFNFPFYYSLKICSDKFDGVLQLIEAANLEKGTKLEDPVMYHKAWQTLCKSE